MNRDYIMTSRRATTKAKKQEGLRDLRLVYRDLEALTPYRRNARTHSRKQIRQIAESITEFGFTNPILVDEKGEIIAGHGRVKAAELLGYKQVPTICIDDLTEAQRRAYIIADNRLAENAGWDRDLLAIEFQYLDGLEIEFDSSITGFEVAEIDFLIEGVDDDDDPDGDAIPELDPNEPAVSQEGDLWVLGRHRLLCADARDRASYKRLMAGRRAQMVFVDPPYNVAIDGHVGGSGSIKHDEFVMASGEMSALEFTSFLEKCLAQLAKHSIDGAIHFVFMDWRHIYELLTAARTVYSEVKNLCVWNKDNGGMGSFYRSKHELIFVFKNGTAPHLNNIQLGAHGRNRTNVWDYPGVNTLRAGRLEDLALHPTVKPVALIADAIRDCSKRGGVVLDAFVGSGTTLIAAQKTGRIAYAMELDPRYVDTAIRRWQAYTGDAALHATDKRPFDEVAVARKAKSAKAKGSPGSRGGRNKSS